jgi:toxin ParE1/3/4
VTYKLSLKADEDLHRLYRYGIMHFGEDQADMYFDGLVARLELIAQQPHLYQRVDDIRQGYRRSVYGSHSIYFRVRHTTVEIMRIISREDF